MVVDKTLLLAERSWRGLVPSSDIQFLIRSSLSDLKPLSVVQSYSSRHRQCQGSTQFVAYRTPSKMARSYLRYIALHPELSNHRLKVAPPRSV